MTPIPWVELFYAFCLGAAVGTAAVLHFLKGDTCSVCDAAMHPERQP